ncbi:MAG: PTS fructose-like transporter subunit IIB [Lachnospiraceae bacterium]
MKIVGVTSCPSGVAHTYMAAEALRIAAKKAGISIKVETQGSGGIENYLSEKEIREAICVILSNDVRIREEERFRGKKVIRMSTAELMERGDSLMKKIKIAFS